MPKRRESLNFGARDLPINHFHVFGAESRYCTGLEASASEPGGSTPSGDWLQTERVGQGNEAARRDPAGARVIVAGLRSDRPVGHEVADARICSEDQPADID